MTLTLVAVGVAACYAAGTYSPTWWHEARQQLAGAVIGGVIFLLAARVDYRIYHKFAKPMFYASLAVLAVIGIVAIIWQHGTGPAVVNRIVPFRNGSHRWLSLVVFDVQVSEVMRFTLAVMVAAMAANMGKRVRDFREGFIPLMIPIAAVVFLVAVEQDLSMAMLLGITGLAVAFVAGVRFVHLLLIAPVLGLGATLMMILSPERMSRLASFMAPIKDCLPHDQVCNSLIGFGSGGVFGVGYGRGTQKLGHMLYASSDFILSVIGEEWGFIGVLFLAICFALLCWMGFRIAVTTRDPFGRALAGGLTTMIAAAGLMHAAVGLSLMPPTGLTLPFISTGRTSLIIYLLATGVLVSIGRRRGKVR